MKWRSNDGVIREIKNMTDRHLVNIINYIGKNGGDINYLEACKEEYDSRQNKKLEIDCPWCGHKMKMHNFEWEDPYPDVGISFPDKWKQLYCSKCKARGPEIRK